MKKITMMVVALIAMTSVASASMLIGWDGTGGSGAGNEAVAVAGVTGNIWLGSIYNSSIDATAGSSDGTFGATETGASTGLNAYAVRTAVPTTQDTLVFTISNATGGSLQLGSIVFDYSRWFNNGPQTVTLTYLDGNGGAGLSGVASNTVMGTFGSSPVAGKAADYTDYEIDFSALSNDTLFSTGTARFSLVVSDALGTTANGAFDNIGITAAAVPEPATVGMLGLGALVALFIRRVRK